MTDSDDPAGPEMTTAKRRLIDHLKRVDGASVAELAERMEISGAAVRQHLDQLADQGLLRRLDPSPTVGRGRPPARWGLTEQASRLFPDRHADLSVELIATIRSELGEDALDRVITARSERQRQGYAEVLVGLPMTERARRLAELRTAEGYEAELAEPVAPADPAGRADGGVDRSRALVLVEHHCPICEAAESCQSLCRDELEVFRSLFDDVATVERTSHLLSGDQRCSYRITPR